MPKFPPPPPVPELALVAPDRVVVPAGTELWRIYLRGGAHPTLWNMMRSFGPTSGRFDPHRPPARDQERRVLYCAEHGPTCLAEVFQDTRIIDRRARDPWLVAFRLERDVTLLDLCGTWPTRAGASMAINTGPRARAREWARAIHSAYEQVEGVRYPSSMCGNRASVALWERGETALPDVPVFHRPLVDPGLLTPLKNAAAELGYGLI